MSRGGDVLTLTHSYSPIKTETSSFPGKVVLKMGIFPRIPQPESEGFGLHRHEWQGIHKDVDVYEMKWAGPERKTLVLG